MRSCLRKPHTPHRQLLHECVFSTGRVLLVALVALVRSRERLALRDVLLQGGIVYICIPFLSSITP